MARYPRPRHGPASSISRVRFKCDARTVRSREDSSNSSISYCFYIWWSLHFQYTCLCSKCMHCLQFATQQNNIPYVPLVQLLYTHITRPSGFLCEGLACETTARQKRTFLGYDGRPQLTLRESLVGCDLFLLCICDDTADISTIVIYRIRMYPLSALKG